MRVLLSVAAEEAISAHGRETYPQECCGILVGKRTAGDFEISEAHRAGNLNTERPRDRFDMDPADYLRIERSARDRGLEALGFYHSHPDHPAVPSKTDAQWAWPALAYLIASVRKGDTKEIRGWWFEQQGGEPREIPVSLQA